MDNPEKMATYGTQDKDKDKLIKGKQEWTIYRNWQQWVHKTQDEDKLIKGCLYRYQVTLNCFGLIFVFK